MPWPLSDSLEEYLKQLKEDSYASYQEDLTELNRNKINNNWLGYFANPESLKLFEETLRKTSDQYKKYSSIQVKYNEEDLKEIAEALDNLQRTYEKKHINVL